MDTRRQILNREKRNIVEYSELNKTIRNITEDLRKYHENRIEKIIQQNLGLKCLRPIMGKLKRNRKKINRSNTVRH